jgi:hypothetical protein
MSEVVDITELIRLRQRVVVLNRYGHITIKFIDGSWSRGRR